MTKIKFAVQCGACAAAFLVTGAVRAQEAGPAPSRETADASEIIVTAQKRSERLNDVPIAITAASADQLTAQGITSPAMLDRIAPGFTFQETHFGTPIFALRGVSFFDSSIGGSPAVSVYVDQVPLPYSIMTRGVSLDLERVEVLKGPQGTLFGQSSTGGAVNYIAAKPTEDTQAGFSIGAGRFNAVSAEAFVSGKIADTLTARIAGRYEYRDGWQKPDMRNDAQFGQSASDRLGQKRLYTGRLLVDWEPTDRFKIELAASGWRDNSEPQDSHYLGFAPVAPRNPLNDSIYVAYGRVVPSPDDARLAGWDPNRRFRVKDDFYQLSARADYQLSDGATLSSITAYSDLKDNTSTDTDGLAYNAFVLIRNASIKSFFQEIRLAGESGRLSWMIAGNYARDHSREVQSNLLGTTNTSVGPFTFNSNQPRNDQRARTYAAFGNLTYEISPQLDVQGSMRYTKQDRDFRGCIADPGNGQIARVFGILFGIPTAAGQCITQSSPGVLLGEVRSSLNEDNISYRAILNWHPDRDTLFYASISRGYKPGSYSVLPGVFASQFAPVTQESVTSYEGGFRFSALNRRINLDGAVFYADYKNKQVLGTALIPPFGNLPKLVNIPKSRIVGVELQATLRPFSGLRVTAGGGYYDTKVEEDPANPVDAFGRATTFVGKPLPATPKWQITGDAEYGFAVGDGMRAFVGGGLTYHSSNYSVFGTNAELLLPAYTLLDARVGIESADERWRLQLWGRNITDEFYYVSKQHGADSIAGLTGMPATYGVTLTYRY